MLIDFISLVALKYRIAPMTDMEKSSVTRQRGSFRSVLHQYITSNKVTLNP